MKKISMQKKVSLALTISLVLVFLVGMNNSCFSEGVDIWDNNTSSWITTFSNGDPIDAATDNPAYVPQIAVDFSGRVYVTYYQHDGVVATRIYLSRYNGTDVRIWDNDAPSWITNFSGGDPIDAATTYGASHPQIAVDSNGKVYVVYEQSNGASNDIYLSRYDGNMRIWDTDGWVAVNTLGNGDPIDATGNSAYAPQIAVDSSGKAYVTYYQSDGETYHIYLNQCDGDNVRIWDNNTSNWITNFALGDPIDTTTDNHADLPQIAVDSSGVVYVVYRQYKEAQARNGVNYRIYLSCYDDTNGVRIWGNDGWTTILTEGVPIDPGTQACGAPQLAVDLNDNVYITYAHEGVVDSVYLNRYDGTDVRIWDNDTSKWISDFANGDSIDPSDGYAYSPQIAVGPSGMVYVVYMYWQGGVQSRNGLLYSGIYLSRYDGEDVKIWSSGGWTDTFSNGDPIDPGTQACGAPQLAVDLNDNVYITYSHEEINSTYLNRYDGEDVRIWDNDTADWVSNFANGDSIDPGGDCYASSPQIAVDLSGRVYVTYMHGQLPKSRIGIYYHVYLDRYVPPSDDGKEENPNFANCFLEGVLGKIEKKTDDIIVLRRFRDEKLLTNPIGKIFVAVYYKMSPLMTGLVKQYPVLHNTTKEILKPVIWMARTCGS